MCVVSFGGDENVLKVDSSDRQIICTKRQNFMINELYISYTKRPFMGAMKAAEERM